MQWIVIWPNIWLDLRKNIKFLKNSLQVQFFLIITMRTTFQRKQNLNLLNNFILIFPIIHVSRATKFLANTKITLKNFKVRNSLCERIKYDLYAVYSIELLYIIKTYTIYIFLFESLYWLFTSLLCFNQVFRIAKLGFVHINLDKWHSTSFIFFYV